jgi:fido (protein-threonine AMPylation protein)
MWPASLGAQRLSRSTKADIRASLERIEAILQEDPEGLRRAEIRDALGARYDEALPDRTLRRRLEQLEDEGRVVRTGKSRAIRYHATESGDGAFRLTGEHLGGGPKTDQQDQAGARAAIALSPEGVEVQRLVRLPRQQREPCTYDRDFLEAYVPGETWYLSERVRDELMATGQTPNPERPAGTYARDILDRLLIDLSWASSRLEGNTYSRLDTQNLLEYGIHAEGKSRQEAQMILNHRAAIRMLVDNVREIDFDRRTLLGLHAALAENLVADPGEEGALRQRPVDIGDTVYRPSGVPQIIRECFDLLITKVREIPDPFEQAFFMMVHIPYLQPFIDVNKRTSRIAANIPFIKGNLCPLSFVEVPHETYIEATIGIYENKDVALLRDLFVWGYRRSCAQYRVVREALGEPDAVRLRYRDQLADLVRETVRSRAPIKRGDFRVWAHDHGIEEEGWEAFVERAMDILLNLTEGVAGRYGLSDEDVDAWRASLGHNAHGQAS